MTQVVVLPWLSPSLFLFIFSWTMPTRPLSTLFSYTTLFRSSTANLLLQSRRRQRSTGVRRLFDRGESRRQFDRDRITVEQDRKSTRLNSSHRCITCAVFCLKKKS